MTKNLDSALEEIELTYRDVVDIADGMTAEIFQPTNNLIEEINTRINMLTTEDIRGYILRLATRAYQMVEIRDKALMKAECAEAIKKEHYATQYAGMEGSTVAKDNQATLAISDSIVAEVLYNLIANLFKSKVDNINRVVDSLKSILISRQQDAKMENSASIGSN